MADDTAIPDERTRVLADGCRIPILGLGVWQVPNGPECENAVRWALEVGYRHIDTAQAYGNEESVGRAVHDSGLAREEVFITTKFYPGTRTRWPKRRRACGGWASIRSTCTSCTGPSKVRAGPGPGWISPRAGLRPLHRCVELQRRRVEQVIAVAGTAPAVNQVQFSPFEYRRALLEACEERDVALEAYSPLGTGRHLADPAVAEVAEDVGRTPAQVLLRWCIQRHTIVLPKSTHRERIEENARVFDFDLSDEAMARLDALDRTGATDRAREQKWW